MTIRTISSRHSSMITFAFTRTCLKPKNKACSLYSIRAAAGRAKNVDAFNLET